jgi:hypothetical protein
LSARQSASAPRGRPEILLLNPLGAALGHYTASLRQMLADCGAPVRSLTLMEPSAPGQSRRRWLRQYLAALRGAAQRRESVVLQTWPLLGYCDYAISRCILRDAHAPIVMHDPVPLARAIGYGRLARVVASLPAVGAHAIVHSRSAARALGAGAGLREILELPHPMFAPRTRQPGERRQVVVRVLGQYKPDRDVRGMERLAAEGPLGWRYEAVGRGWPAVAGWSVTDRFVAEEQLDELIRTSSAVLVPYVRFFQSGMAIRALELGTPVVGPRSSSLAELLGADSDWLLDGERWEPALQAAVGASPEEAHRVGWRAYETARERWGAWLQQVEPRTRGRR